MTTSVAGIMALGCNGATGAEPPRVIRGIATVIDGDGVEIDGVQIRLFGIDAPEVGQYCYRADRQRWRCGQYSTVELDKVAGGKRVECSVKATDRYDRPVAVCRLDGRDLAELQAAGGWALAYRRFSGDYVEEEQQAKSAKRGVWAGTFEMPWAWRQRVRAQEDKR